MIDYDSIREFYDRHRSEQSDDPDFLRGTIEESLGVVRFRNRAEARHLARVLPMAAGSTVLDLGGGTGRWSIWFAERGARVTMIELAESLAQGAARNAARRGLTIDHRVGSILEPPLAADECFDVLHIGNVLVYINDADLPRVRALVRKHAKPRATLVIREPVDPHGPSEYRTGAVYRALFRTPESYLQLFEPDWELRYQRTSVSHLVPRGRDTRAVVHGLQSSRLRRALVDAVLPQVAYIDYALLTLEERLRASPLRGLLGDPGVVQRFYVFQRRS
jgi:2-polyprenyl-3-methyl-5-hydroxy-6-metoxy-1,4-benzoquinol methylase